MANLLLRSSNERQTKLNFLPVTPVTPVTPAKPVAIAPVTHDSADGSHTTPASTRRASRSSPLLALGADDTPVEQPARSPAPPAARKRSATALGADTPDPRPPTKVTVTQPHGELVRFTNGVPALLGVAADELPSTRSSPRPRSAGRLAVPTPTPASASASASASAPSPSPTSGPQAQDKRSLRSHDGGSRLKSDLAIYFSSYDDVIAGLPAQSDLVDLETPIYIIDEPIKSKPAVPLSSTSASVAASACQPPPPSYTPSQPLDYATIAKCIRSDGLEDPLDDAFFFAQHRRAERKEKQLRNIEKERAMHEKLQLERLLDGLQGPDWLKVMGVTGVTDGERKDWESKRDYFVKEVEALVDKFRLWKEEEKRLRAEKEAALAARDDDEAEDGEETEESEGAPVNRRDHPVAEQRPKEPEPPKPRRPPRPHGFLLPFVPPEPAVPFSSFYSKPHLRTAALSKHRHGRNATAFGMPIPEFRTHEFALPEDFKDPQFLRDNARERRRRKRESGAGTQSSAQ